MKNTILGIIFTLFSVSCYTSYSQDKIKFGNVSKEDLLMTSYEADTSAVAVVLHEACEVRYDVIGDDMKVITNYTTRIKILKTSGLERGDFSISYYYNGKTNESESLTGIAGNTYNMEDGKEEKTKLTKEYIFKEKVSDTRELTKIAFPNVKVGSIVELKYQLTSPYYSYIDDYYFQQSIPVRYSVYKITIPEYYRFSKKTMGHESIAYSEKSVNMSFLFSKGYRHACTASEMTFEVNNLPALKNDMHIWNVNDFKAMVSFELAGVQFPGAVYKNFAYTWEDVDKQLMEHESFGRQIRISSLLKNELQATISEGMSEEQKMSAILSLVKEKIKWNDENRLYIKSIRNALKEGVGTSADMNGLLISLLRDAGFDAYPVVMSSRNNGRIFPSYPSRNKLNYFIAGVDVSGVQYYMDASSKYGTLNVLSPGCMVENARAIRKDKAGTWVSLHNIGKSIIARTVIAKFNDEGLLSGVVTRQTSGVFSMLTCRNFSEEKNEEEYVEKMSTTLKVDVSDFEIEGCEIGMATQKFSFKNEDISLDSEYLYINPVLFYAETENPFKAETRKLPIEFSHPYDEITNVMFYIPEGYEVEELPKSEKITLDEGSITLTYLIKNEDNMVKISQRLSLKQTIFPSTSYDEIRNLWAYIVNKNNEQVVLKRTIGVN